MGSRVLDDKHVLDWDEEDVQEWFSGLGYPQYQQELRENNIRGDTLCMLDAEALVSLGVKTVGQRLSILKSIYNLKVAHGMPLNEDDYVPPSLASGDHVSVEVIHSSVKDQGMSFMASGIRLSLLKLWLANRIRALEENNRLLSLSLQSFAEEIAKLHSAITVSEATPKASYKQPSFLQSKPSTDDGLPPSIARKTRTDNVQQPAEQLSASQKSSNIPATGNASYPKLSLEDPTWKVLPAALKKHDVPQGFWQDYAMFISYGPSGNRAKRRLEPDEKPLYLFKKLKETGHNPAFLLKNLKEREFRTPGPELESQQEGKSYHTPPGISKSQLSLYPSPPPSRSTSSLSIDPL